MGVWLIGMVTKNECCFFCTVVQPGVSVPHAEVVLVVSDRACGTNGRIWRLPLQQYSLLYKRMHMLGLATYSTARPKSTVVATTWKNMVYSSTYGELVPLPPTRGLKRSMALVAFSLVYIIQDAKVDVAIHVVRSR